VDVLENNVVWRWRRNVDGRAYPYRHWGIHRDRQQEDAEWRRRWWEKKDWQWWQKKDWRWGRRLKCIDWIVENQNRPLNIDDLLRRRWWHVVGYLGERGWRLESGGEKSKAATRISRVWPTRVAPQVRPIGVRRIDRSGAAPDYRLSSRGGDGPYTFGHRIIGISSEEVVITLQGVAL
jgi:hypothetical protein